jgi:hypothetical protein
MTATSDSVPNNRTFYDKYLPNALHYKKKKTGTHEFGLELEPIIPSAGEVRLLGNRHRHCAYYGIGKRLNDKLSSKFNLICIF